MTDGAGNTWHFGRRRRERRNHIYVVNRDMMGKFNISNDNAIYQEISSNGFTGGGVWASPAYFNDTVYYGAVSDYAEGFRHHECEARDPSQLR